MPVSTNNLRASTATVRQTLPTHQRTLNRRTSAATLTGILTGGTGGGNSGPSHSPSQGRRISYAPPTAQTQAGTQGLAPQPVQHQPGTMTPVFESVQQAMKNNQSLEHPTQFTADDFTRAVAVATVSALRHQQGQRKPVAGMEHEDTGGHGGHDAPSWSRTVSASVLLGCTALYAIIAGELFYE
jgi:Ca2+:H+ antiporter